MLRNPAYKGTACFGKTETAQRQRITRSLRMRGGVGSRDSAHHERPRADWIEIAVPAIVTDDIFMRAQELLEQNKVFAPRRTIEPSIVQGLVSCRKCGYAMSRTSTRSSARKIHYYRCLGSDAWRRLGGPVCDNRPVRQDLLDRVVWTEVVRLLEDPSLIQNELDRRLAAARTADPARQRENVLHREVARTRNSIDRLLTAYQEELLSLDELRRRMPELRQREHALQTELRAILDQVNDRAVYLRLAETLSAFLDRLRSSADTLDIQERQRIVRLIVKEILIEDESIIVRHSIPVSQPPDDPKSPPSRSGEPADQSYLLRSGRRDPTLRRPSLSPDDAPIRHLHRGFQPSVDVQKRPRAIGVLAHCPHQQFRVNAVKEGLDIKIKNPVTTPASLPRHADRIERRFAGPASIGIRVELWLHRRFQMPFDHHLGDAISDRGNAQRARLAVALRYVDPPHRWRKVAARRQTIPEFVEVVSKISLEVRNRSAVYASRPLVGSNPLIGFPYLPFRNVIRLCSVHEGPPVAGCP
jgi:site-specific DNA recombinase